jgi:hypothetical protein
MPLATIVGATVIVRHEGWTELRLPAVCENILCVPDGPGDSSQERTAAKIGVSVREMNAGHDLTHCLLAEWIGLPYSPTLASVAGGPLIESDLNAAEEAAVLALQRYLNVLGLKPSELTKWFPVEVKDGQPQTR